MQRDSGQRAAEVRLVAREQLRVYLRSAETVAALRRALLASPGIGLNAGRLNGQLAAVVERRAVTGIDGADLGGPYDPAVAVAAALPKALAEVALEHYLQKPETVSFLRKKLWSTLYDSRRADFEVLAVELWANVRRRARAKIEDEAYAQYPPERRVAIVLGWALKDTFSSGASGTGLKPGEAPGPESEGSSAFDEEAATNPVRYAELRAGLIGLYRDGKIPANGRRPHRAEAGLAALLHLIVRVYGGAERPRWLPQYPGSTATVSDEIVRDACIVADPEWCAEPGKNEGTLRKRRFDFWTPLTESPEIRRLFRDADGFEGTP